MSCKSLRDRNWFDSLAANGMNGRVRKPIPGGLLIAVEGIDGAGKTTIAALLAQFFGERGIPCAISKEPTGLKWGTEMRNSAAEGRLTLEDELRLFILDRSDHVERAIRPALEEECVVILDRYYWSTAAYQGARGANVAEIIAANEAFAPKPDLWLLLDVARGDEPNSFEEAHGLAQAKEIFIELSKSDSNCVRIDASVTLRQVHQLALLAMQRKAMNKISASGLGPEQLNATLVLMGGDPISEAN
jgi:dTMP kinase